jgi:hypothetical protein
MREKLKYYKEKCRKQKCENSFEGYSPIAILHASGEISP